MKIKKGDKIKVITGKDLGKEGKVLRVFRDTKKVVVAKLNIIKKHLRPRKEGEKGQIVEIPSPINISNVMLVCPKCSEKTKVGYEVKDGIKNRICKKCKAQIS